MPLALLMLLTAAPTAEAAWVAKLSRLGTAWELRVTGCQPVSITRLRRGASRLEGPDWSMEGIFEVRERRARLAGSLRWSLDGGLGLSGTSAITEPLALREGALEVAGRRLFLDAASCANAGKL